MLPINRSALVLEVRRLADIETDGYHITDDEIAKYLNDALKALWSLIIAETDGTLLSRLITIPPQIGTNAFQMPDDFLRLISVDVRKSNRIWIHSTAADPQQYAQLSTLSSNQNVFASQHYIQFNKDTGSYELFIFPPVEDTDLFVRYIPEAPYLPLETSELRLPDDWVRWAIFDSAIRCYIKNETDPSPVMVEREKIEQRIMVDVAAQSPAQVQKIRDIWEQEELARGLYPPPINLYD